MLVADDAAEVDVLRAVSRAGYRARPADRAAPDSGAPFWRREARAASTSLSVLLLLVAVIASLVSAPCLVAEPLYLLSMAVGGWPVARAAASALRRRPLDMNVLSRSPSPSASAVCPISPCSDSLISSALRPRSSPLSCAPLASRASSCSPVTLSP